MVFLPSNFTHIDPLLEPVSSVLGRLGASWGLLGVLAQAVLASSSVSLAGRAAKTGIFPEFLEFLEEKLLKS